MRKISALFAVLMICVLLAGTALAGTTAPYSLQEESTESVRSGGKEGAFPKKRFYRGISATDNWVYQVRLDGIMINLQLFERSGNGISFQENLTRTKDDGVRLVLRQYTNVGNALLQLDQHALDVLRRVGITEIVVTDYDLYIQNTYQVATLEKVREMLGLRAGEELSVGSLSDPVSVVDESGVRRILSE
ncbi:MAG: hypothetical protein IJ088_14320 [Clostridia bacterium]|nr:hypothetical protein [Clostridia bacterium]